MTAEHAITRDEARNIVRQMRSIATKIEGSLNAQLGRLADRSDVESLRRLADRVAHDAGLDADDPQGVPPHDDEQPQPLEGGTAHRVTLTDSIAGSDDLAGG